ncbi:MAG: metallophosphoesterase [Armatimonadetes bacterium]|nr:metallophosphoesterase [Armatimonadota bacterium]
MLSRRELLQGLAGAGIASSLFAPHTAEASARGFRFVHITDFHIQPELGAADGVALAVKKLRALNPRPDFIITGGDHVMDALDVTRERAETQFRLFRETMKLLSNDPPGNKREEDTSRIPSKLDIPIYQTIGNHDVYGWTKKDGNASTEAGYGKKMFQEWYALNRTYYSIDFSDWHFIILDSIQPKASNSWRAEIDDAQLQWLKDDLAQVGKTRPVVIVTHVPLMTLFTQLTESTLKVNSDSGVVRNGKEVRDIFVPYNVKAVLQGHTHIVEECIYTDTRYITSGAVCGEWWKGPRLGVHPEGFAVFDVKQNSLKWEYVPYGWKARAN